MNEDRTQPNPDWREPDDGEICGAGFDDKGTFRLVYRAAKGAVVRVYANAREIFEIGKESDNEVATNWNGRVVVDDKPRRFRLNADDSIEEITPSSNDSP